MDHSQIHHLAQFIDYSDGGIVSKKIIQKPGGNITLFAFDEGQELSEHTSPFEALVSVVEGTVEILIEGNPYKVEEGHAIILPAEIPHALKAVTKFKMLLVMIK